MVWNPGNSSATAMGSLGSVPSGAVLRDVTLMNTGTNPLYLQSGSVSAAVATGLLFPAGAQLTIQGYLGTGAAAGTIWANTSVVGTSGAVTAGLASVASVV